MSLERFRLKPDEKKTVEYGTRKAEVERVMLGIDTGRFPVVSCELKFYDNRFVVWEFGVFELGAEGSDGEGLGSGDNFSRVGSVYELGEGQLVVLGDLVALVGEELGKRNFDLDLANNFRFSGIAFRG